MNEGTVITAATDRLLQYGVLGIMVIVFGVVIWVLWRDFARERKEYVDALRDLQLSRVEDAKATQTQMIEVVKQCTMALSSAATTIETFRETMIELRDTLRDFGDELRNRPPRR